MVRKLIFPYCICHSMIVCSIICKGIFVSRFMGDVCANITPWGTTVKSARIFIMTPPGDRLEALTHMFAEVNTTRGYINNNSCSSNYLNCKKGKSLNYLWTLNIVRDTNTYDLISSYYFDRVQGLILYIHPILDVLGYK